MTPIAGSHKCIISGPRGFLVLVFLGDRIQFPFVVALGNEPPRKLGHVVFVPVPHLGSSDGTPAALALISVHAHQQQALAAVLVQTATAAAALELAAAPARARPTGRVTGRSPRTGNESAEALPPR
jgi:hypothetical protein